MIETRRLKNVVIFVQTNTFYFLRYAHMRYVNSLFTNIQKDDMCTPLLYPSYPLLLLMTHHEKTPLTDLP